MEKEKLYFIDKITNYTYRTYKKKSNKYEKGEK